MFPEAYKRLAERLDSLPNGFPPTDDGIELRLLSLLFTPEEADLASRLRLSRETPEQIADRLGGDPGELRQQLKGMSRRGLIGATRLEAGIGFGLIPFVVGIYEYQVARLDAEMAQIFEEYYQRAFGQVLSIQPSVHRVIPVKESVRMDMEIRPYESAVDILDSAQAWGVLDCICRKQKALIGDPCDHPLDVCLALSQRPGAFDQGPVIRALTRDEALDTLQRAAAAGLVHSVSNSQSGFGYVCNCCTCGCGILRGMSDLGIANVVARSPFVNQVDEALCYGCELCLDYCQFDALALEEGLAVVKEIRCVGCGVCVPACPETALVLVRRPAEEIQTTPSDEMAWLQERAQVRGIDLRTVL